MKDILEAVNEPVKAFEKRNRKAAYLFAAAAILLNAAFEPLLRFVCGIQNKNGIGHTFLLILLGVMSYLVICILFFAIGKLFGSELSLTDCLNTWGMTYLPTALCAVVVAVTETFFYIFWNHSIWGMLLNIVFIMILIWKTTLYFLFTAGFMKIKGIKLFAMTCIMAIVIYLLAFLDAYLGLKTPML